MIFRIFARILESIMCLFAIEKGVILGRGVVNAAAEDRIIFLSLLN